MNKKQMMVTGILLSLMMVMVFMQQFFDTNILKAALVNNNIQDVQEYSALDGNIVYKLPDNWRCETVDSNEYITYNNKFSSEEMGILGYIQILNTKTTVDELIEIDKKIFNAEMVNNIKTGEEKIGDTKIKSLRYDEKLSTGKIYNTKAYYFSLENNIKLKIVFSASMDKYRESYETVYRYILESFKAPKRE